MQIHAKERGGDAVGRAFHKFGQAPQLQLVLLHAQPACADVATNARFWLQSYRLCVISCQLKVLFRKMLSLLRSSGNDSIQRGGAHLKKGAPSTYRSKR